jgi:hypothetical protein
VAVFGAEATSTEVAYFDVSDRRTQGRVLEQSTNRLLSEKQAVVYRCSHHSTLFSPNNAAL